MTDIQKNLEDSERKHSQILQQNSLDSTLDKSATRDGPLPILDSKLEIKKLQANASDQISLQFGNENTSKPLDAESAQLISEIHNERQHSMGFSSNTTEYIETNSQSEPSDRNSGMFTHEQLQFHHEQIQFHHEQIQFHPNSYGVRKISTNLESTDQGNHPQSLRGTFDDRNMPLLRNMLTTESREDVRGVSDDFSEQKISKKAENSKSIEEQTSKTAEEQNSKNVEEQSPQQKPKPEKAEKLTLLDFKLVASIGKGAYGEVILVKKKSNNQQYAMKVFDKFFLEKERKTYQVYVEKDILRKVSHPGIVKLSYTFQDTYKLYFVLELISGGSFSDYLQSQNKLPPEVCRYYAAEIIVILEYLHSKGITHRDLKPENLMLDEEGHLKIIDFGTAKYMNSDMRTAEMFDRKRQPNEKSAFSWLNDPQKFDRGRTFVGTALYISPEMLESNDGQPPTDIWALGCIIYYMSTGKLPFVANNEYLLFQMIKENQIVYPSDMDEDTKDLISKLLVKDPTARLGAGPAGSPNDYEALKSHPFFKGIDFSDMANSQPECLRNKAYFKNKLNYKEIPPEIKKAYEKAQRKARLLQEKALKEAQGIGKDEKLTGQSTTNSQTIRSINGQSSSGQLASKTSNSKPEESKQPLKSEGKNFGPKPEENKINQVSTSPPKRGKIILSGMIAKRQPYLFYYQTRMLVLSDEPRLRYYNPETKELRLEIPLETTTVAEVDGDNKMIIRTATTQYNFKTLDHRPEKWVRAINSLCQKERAKALSRAGNLKGIV